MLRKPAYDWPMISADELRDARLRAGYTSQADLARALGVSLRTITEWEKVGSFVSVRGEAKVRALLWPAPAPLSGYSNYELLSELGRRLDWAQSEMVRKPDDTELNSDPNDPDTGVGSVNDVNTSREQSSSSPAPGGEKRGDSTQKSGPRTVKGRGPRIT